MLTALSIVSDSTVLCEGLAMLLAAYPEFDLVGSYRAEPSPAELLPNPAGHVVLLDAGIGRDLTMVWTRYWRMLARPAAVIVIELPHQTCQIGACIEAGAGGYTLRGASIAEVIQTIYALRQGTAHCSPEVTSYLFMRLEMLRCELSHARGDGMTLTTREIEVLRYIAADFSNQQIADALVIEVRTVKHHVHNILDKLKLRHRWEAARYAVEQGWLPDQTSVIDDR